MRRRGMLFAAFCRAGSLILIFSGVVAGADDSSPPTWSRDVAPILYGHCVECHRPEEVAPFSLLTHADAAKRARFIVKAVKAHYMPPWLPDGPAGAFLDERRLSEAEIGVLVRWADAGAPAGDPAAAPVPPPARTNDWILGPPDLVVRMPRPFDVPPGPADTFRVFPATFDLASVPPDVLARARIPESDVLGVAAIEIRPGTPRVFHHAAVWADSSGVARQREAAAGGNGYESFGSPGFSAALLLGTRVPGMTPRFLPPGIAASVVPLTGDLAFHIHYRATGRPATDQSEVGIHFMRQPVRRIMDSLPLRSFRLDIPAGEPNYVVEDTLTIPAECALMSIWPHMHLLAREVHVTLINPDGTTRPLLDISRWNFKWQDRYVYREPIILPKGARVHSRWVFDNSEDNPNNPHSPPRLVRFGPDATDEMCAVDLGVIVINLDEAPLLAAATEAKLREKIDELTPEQRARYRWEDAFER